MHAHGLATLLDEHDEIEGGMSARPSPNTLKPSKEETVRLGVQHLQHLLLPEVDDVQLLGKGMEANMLLHCVWKV